MTLHKLLTPALHSCNPLSVGFAASSSLTCIPKIINTFFLLHVIKIQIFIGRNFFFFNFYQNMQAAVRNQLCFSAARVPCRSLRRKPRAGLVAANLFRQGKSQCGQEPSCIGYCKLVPVGNTFSTADTAKDTKLQQLFRQLMANSQLCYWQQTTNRRTSPPLLHPLLRQICVLWSRRACVIGFVP